MYTRENFLEVVKAMLSVHFAGVQIPTARRNAGLVILFAVRIPNEEIPDEPEILVAFAEQLISYVFHETEEAPDWLTLDCQQLV